MKKYMLFALVLMSVFAVGCTEKPIGGERDEHGCLPTAGYTWCESKQKCLRTWEEECPGMISSFEECVAAGNPVMESYPRQCRTEDGKTFVEEIIRYCTEEEKAAEICTLDYTPVCGDNGVTYGNACQACASGEIDSYTMGECEKLTYEEALSIAQDSECVEKGSLTDTYMYNEFTKTWWIDLDMKPEFENKLCNPACVASEETKTAEINWRCTGALPP